MAKKNQIRPANDCPEFDLKFHRIMIKAEWSTPAILYLRNC